MIEKVFQNFKQKAITTSSLNSIFYQSLNIKDTNLPIFEIIITSEMCDSQSQLHKSGLVSLIDGCTIMAFMGKYNLSSKVVSLSMNTRFFQDCRESQTLQILPQVIKFYSEMGSIKAEVTCEGNLIADSIHNVIVLRR